MRITLDPLLISYLYFIIHPTHIIKSFAVDLGFDLCGIAQATYLEQDAQRLDAWLRKGFHGTMQYMENHFDLRVDPQKLVPGARSVITLISNYYPQALQNPNAPLIAKYAYGEDYHLVIRKKLHLFLDRLRTEYGNVEGRGFVDSAPVLERAWAVRSGLGWVGKNGNLIIPKMGSYFFISTLITDLNLEPDVPFQTDHCGDCRLCIDACPTQAIEGPAQINSNKCISYLTIEWKGETMPEPFAERKDNWLFGCDICQDVCPWNRFKKPHNEIGFQPYEPVLQFSRKDWFALSELEFQENFKKSPLKRSKYVGIQKNLKAIYPDYKTL